VYLRVLSLRMTVFGVAAMSGSAERRNTRRDGI
jgi:hypothetical protein